MIFMIRSPDRLSKEAYSRCLCWAVNSLNIKLKMRIIVANYPRGKIRKVEELISPCSI